MRPATIDLASNRNPWGPAESVRARLQQAILGPDPEDLTCLEGLGDPLLCAILAHQQGLPPGQVILGQGSTDVLGLAAQLVLASGGSCLQPKFSYRAAAQAALAMEARLVESAASLVEMDVDRLLQAVQPDTRLVYLAQVNNPTGTRVEGDALTWLVRRLREDILLVVDQAYVEYEDAGGLPTVASLLADRERLLVLRTFSKLHGLGALRAGYGFGSPGLIARLAALRPLFTLNRLSLLAAETAIQDRPFVERCRLRNEEARMAFIHEAQLHRCQVMGEAGNFMVLETVFPGEELAKDLLRRGLAVKPLEVSGLSQHVRVSLGSADQMDLFWNVATPLLDGAGCSRNF